MTDEITVTLDDIPAVSALEAEWTGLEERCRPSFFTSWSWMGAWLHVLPEALRPQLMRIKEGGNTIGLGLFVRNRVTRRGVLRSRGVYLHATGMPALDALYVEYNGLLVPPEHAGRAFAACMDFFLERPGLWDEVFFDGIAGGEARVPGDFGRASLVARKQSVGYFVDLKKIRDANTEYLSCLSANTRSQIRRALKEYGKIGEVRISAASSLDEALDFMQGLGALHQAYWRGRGMPGAFSNTLFAGFHEFLIRGCFDKGGVQLLRVHAGGRTIGYLYNLVARGHVCNYQSGFDYGCVAQHSRPGLVSHMLAIDHNLRCGAEIYDFLAGDAQYKRSLGSGQIPMTWLVLQKNLCRFRVERWLKRVQRYVTADGSSGRPHAVSASGVAGLRLTAGEED